MCETNLWDEPGVNMESGDDEDGLAAGPLHSTPHAATVLIERLARLAILGKYYKAARMSG